MNEKDKNINEESVENDKVVDISSKENKANKSKAEKSKAGTKPAKPKAEKAPKKEKAPKADKEPKEDKKKAQKLTLDHLKKEDKKLVIKKTEIITINGSDYEVVIDNYFKKTKKRDMINDMIKFFQMLGERNMQDFEMVTAYTMLLLVKHFTDLEVPDDIDEAMATLEVLIDTEAIGQIVSHLPEKEVVEMYELLTKTVNDMTDKMEELEAEIEKADGDIENPKVKAYLKKTLGDDVVEESSDKDNG